MAQFKPVVKFESMSEAVAFLRKEHALGTNGAVPYYVNWDVVANCYEKCVSGETRLVAEAEKLMDQIEAASYHISAKTTISDVHGPRLNMGEYLAGVPTCFRRHRKQSTMANVPANFYVCVGYGSNVTAQQTFNRGVAITALVAKLTAIRPVNFYVIDENISRDGQLVTTSIRLESTPLNMAQVAYCMTNAAYVDAVVYSAARCHGHSIQWPRAKWALLPKEYATMVLRQLGEENPESSLYLSGVDNTEIAEFNDPIKWVNEKLALFAGLDAMED